MVSFDVVLVMKEYQHAVHGDIVIYGQSYNCECVLIGIQNQSLQSNQFANSMAKYYKAYLHNKKESNISLPLRFSFLKSIFIEGLSVKNAAIKWKMHYSSAKIIARMAKRTNLGQLFSEDLIQQMPKKECGWKEIKISPNPGDITVKESEGESTPASANTLNNMDSQGRQIQIVSTIGWSYLSPSYLKLTN